jgi:hypothetical protein
VTPDFKSRKAQALLFNGAAQSAIIAPKQQAKMDYINRDTIGGTMATLYEQLLHTQGILDAAGAEYVVAGGYARDLFWHCTPRDVDIWIISAPESLRYTLMSFGFIEVPTAMDDYNDCCDLPRVDKVYKWQDVDVILTPDHVSTERDIIDTFDFPINQCLLDSDGAPWYPNYPPKPYQWLKPVRDNVSPERLLKMKKWIDKL